MSKILLVYDDFAELNATELSLKKASFDVIGLTNEYTVKDQIVAFNPDILVGLGNSQRVSCLSVGKKIKEMTRWNGKSILIFPKDYTIPADDLLRMRMDMILETPVSVIRLIQIICKLLKSDERAILEKLAKSFAKDRADDLAFASYDSATVKAIQHIQGELESLDSKKVSDKGAPDDSDRVGAGRHGSSEDLEKSEKAKKSLFEKDPIAPVSPGDPFAELISELKGEAVKKSVEAKSDTPSQRNSNQINTDETAESSEAEVDLEKMGDQLRKEIEAKSVQLSERIKKYSAMTADLKINPESTIKKTKAKAELKRLKDGLNMAELEVQDQSRRQFVTALFASKKDKK